MHALKELIKKANDYPRDNEKHKIFLDFFEKIKMDTTLDLPSIKMVPKRGMNFMTDEEI